MRESDVAAFTVPNADAMRQLGADIGKALLDSNAPAQCVALEGELGAGKTTLVSGVLAAAGIEGPVRSPTYTLIEPYEATGRFIYHLDLYRLTDPGEIEPLGIRDLLHGGSILLIEWPSRGQGRLPPIDLSIELSYVQSGEGRAVRAVAGSSAGIKVLEHLLR